MGERDEAREAVEAASMSCASALAELLHAEQATHSYVCCMQWTGTYSSLIRYRTPRDVQRRRLRSWQSSMASKDPHPLFALVSTLARMLESVTRKTSTRFISLDWNIHLSL